MNQDWSLHLKITNWCNLNCIHCCECSRPSLPLNLLPLEKIDKYVYESMCMLVKPNKLISIGGGEVMAPYLHNDIKYIPNLLDTVYKYGFVPTLKTNGTWGNKDNKRTKILTDIAKCAYKAEKLVTLDISVDEFHNNQNAVIKIITDVLNEYFLCYAIRICLVGFCTKNSLDTLNDLKNKLSKKGFNIQETNIGDWIISSPNGNTVCIYNDFTSSIFNIGRAKENKVYTTNSNYPDCSSDEYNCLQLDNNDLAIYNNKYREPINNRNLGEVLSLLQDRARGC